MLGGGGGRVGAAWYDLELRDEGFLGQVQQVGSRAAAGAQPAADAMDDVADKTREAGDAADETGGKFSKFGDIGKGAIMGVGLAIGNMATQFVMQAPAEAMRTLSDSISLASDKAEAAAKAGELFGDSYRIVEEASKDAATSVGLSSGAYLDSIGTLGNLITNLGFAGDEAANMSVDMLALAADMGSFNNASTEDVVYAMGAAFRGETEPIRRFGVMLDEAGVKAKAMELGLYDGVGAMDKNAKATATYQLILEQTAAAQGDFARTSDGLANGQRIAAARIEEAWTTVGEALMPIAETIVPMVADAVVGLVGVIGEVVDLLLNNGPAVAGAVGAIGIAVATMVVPPMLAWAAATIVALAPLIALAAAGAALVLALEHFGILDDVISMLGELGRIAGEMVAGAFRELEWIVVDLGTRLGGLIGIFENLFGAMIDAGDAIIRLLQGDFEGAAAAAERALNRIGGVGESVQRVLEGAGSRAAWESEKAAEATAAAHEEAARKTAEEWDASEEARRRGAEATTAAVQREAGAQAQANADAAAATRTTAQAIADETGASLSEVQRLHRQTGVELVDVTKTSGADQLAALRAANRAIIAEAAWGGQQTPRAYGQGIASGYAEPVSAMDRLKDLMKNTLSPVQKEAELIGILTSKRLANALDDGRPEVRLEAQQITLDSIRELAKLNPQSEEIGRMSMRLLASATAAQRPALRASLAEILGVSEQQLGQLPGIFGDAGRDSGAAFLRQWGIKKGAIMQDLQSFTRGVANQVRLMSPARTGPWSEAGGPIAWMGSAADRMTDAFVENFRRGRRRADREVGLFAETVAGIGSGSNIVELLAERTLNGQTIPIELRHRVEIDGRNLPPGVTNEGVAAIVGTAIDFDAEWARKMAAAQSASGLRWTDR
ncbi:MAG TPA: hypothetical protein VM305_08390 [Candidatus Limnocylindrales bacterium]|nr:hypothetical protein [Candidatus Limnocylindrales bacterium]